jgi:hypothetical protein
MISKLRIMEFAPAQEGTARPDQPDAHGENLGSTALANKVIVGGRA